MAIVERTMSNGLATCSKTGFECEPYHHWVIKTIFLVETQKVIKFLARHDALFFHVQPSDCQTILHLWIKVCHTNSPHDNQRRLTNLTQRLSVPYLSIKKMLKTTPTCRTPSGCRRDFFTINKNVNLFFQCRDFIWWWISNVGKVERCSNWYKQRIYLRLNRVNLQIAWYCHLIWCPGDCWKYSAKNTSILFKCFLGPFHCQLTYFAFISFQKVQPISSVEETNSSWLAKFPFRIYLTSSFQDPVV